MEHERGHSHYRRLPQQTSTTSLFLFYSSISSSFLQLSSLSAHPSSARFTPLILDCLSFLRLEKLALDSQSVLTEEIRVQWCTVASCVPISNRNTYNSSRLSTHSLNLSKLHLRFHDSTSSWIERKCRNFQWKSLLHKGWIYSIYLSCIYCIVKIWPCILCAILSV